MAVSLGVESSPSGTHESYCELDSESDGQYASQNRPAYLVLPHARSLGGVTQCEGRVTGATHSATLYRHGQQTHDDLRELAPGRSVFTARADRAIDANVTRERQKIITSHFYGIFASSS